MSIVSFPGFNPVFAFCLFTLLLKSRSPTTCSMPPASIWTYFSIHRVIFLSTVIAAVLLALLFILSIFKSSHHLPKGKCASVKTFIYILGQIWAILASLWYWSIWWYWGFLPWSWGVPRLHLFDFWSEEGMHKCHSEVLFIQILPY